MAGKVIAVANMKGGVGKTATVVALAEALAADKREEVLVIDADAQANASVCIAGDKLLAQLIREGQTIDAYLDDYLLQERKLEFETCIRAEISDVTHMGEQLPISLLAASPELRLLERMLIYKLTKQRFDLDNIVNRILDLMQDNFKASKKSYDYILVDCAPGISILSEVSIRLADLVLVPTIPDSLSTYGLQAFCNNLYAGEPAKRSALKKPRNQPYVVITRRRPINEHNTTIERMRSEKTKDKPAFHLFETEVPERAAIAQALGKADEMRTFTKKWTSDVVTILNALMQETKEALDGH